VDNRIKYLKLLVSRSWNDTWQTLGYRIVFSLVFGSIMTAILSWSAMLSWLLSAAITSIVVFSGLYFIQLIFVTPYRLWKENQKPELDLDIEVPEMNIIKTNTDAVIFHLNNLRITNRSKTDKVNLGLVLEIQFSDNPTKQQELRLGEGQFGNWGQSDRGLLRTPLKLDAPDTISGDVEFFLPPALEPQFREQLWPQRKAILLHIWDHVSGKIITRNIPLFTFLS
jgi:hypothetical protein